jgi:hypothetical protein
VVNDVPQRFLRAAVKIRPRYQNIANIWCLERGDIGLFIGY